MSGLVGLSLHPGEKCSDVNVETSQHQGVEKSLDYINKKLFEKLIQVIGTEEIIKNRQKMFIVQDIINSCGDIDSIPISGGSLSEGLDIENSDEDLIYILKDVSVVNNRATESNCHIQNCTVIVMDTEVADPGYIKLLEPQTVYQNNYITNGVVEIQGNSFVSSSKFRRQFIVPGIDEHGPCTTDGERDFAICLYSPHWPDQANDWISRVQSSGKLSCSLIESITTLGCILVAVGPKHSKEYSLSWRISFSFAEKKLIHAMNHPQILCYGLLKIFLKEVLDREDTVKELLCSYFMKTVVFWVIEKVGSEVWRLDNVLFCFMLCLDELIGWVKDCFCPNYFIPENNMFAGRIHSGNNHKLHEILLECRSENYRCLFRCETFQSFTDDDTSVPTAHMEANLDLLCFRVLHSYPIDVLNLAYKSMLNADIMLLSEESSFTTGVIRRIRALIHQGIAQLLQPTGSNKLAYRVMKQQLAHLVIGCNADMATGHLLLASFFHVNGRFEICLRMLDSIIHRCTPDIICLRKPKYTKREGDIYREKYCGRNLSLHNKIQNATVGRINMQDNSSVMPKEFQPEVDNYRPLFIVPPVVFAHCLKFLCYYHLKDDVNSNQSLSDLKEAVLNDYLILPTEYAHSRVLLGACYEVFGDKNEAIRYYKIARDHVKPSRSAEYRLKRLENENMPKTESTSSAQNCETA